MPADTVRHLPAGVFYLLAGPDLNNLSLWEVTAGGQEKLLTPRRPGAGIDAFAASPAGIVVADTHAGQGADHLARLTRHGAAWLRLGGPQGAPLRGSSPDMRGNGTLGYVIPPGRSGRAEFSIWIRHAFTGPATMVLRQRRALDGPVFGPDGQFSVEGWAGRRGHRQPCMVIYRHGQIRKVRTGVSAIPSLEAWGEHAPALALAFPAHQAELLFLGGRRQPLPRGWQPLAWNPAGTELLMQSATALGVWSATAPAGVTPIGPVIHGMQLLQASWLDHKAPV